MFQKQRILSKNIKFITTSLFFLFILISMSLLYAPQAFSTPQNYTSNDVLIRTFQIKDNVSAGTTDQPIICIEVDVQNNSTATEFFFNSNGTTSITEGKVYNAKLYYTGASTKFTPARILGSVVDPSTRFSFKGFQSIPEGKNYFWLTYDIGPEASNGVELDAECISIIINNEALMPNITAPSGSRMIMNPEAGNKENHIPGGVITIPFESIESNGMPVLSIYDTEKQPDKVTSSPFCASSANNQDYEWIVRVKIHDGVQNSGPTPYSDYTDTPLATLTAGTTYNVEVDVATNGVTWHEYVKIWFDMNQNDAIEDPEELVFNVDKDVNTLGTFSGTVTVPSTAFNGHIYVRIIMQYNANPSLCGTYVYGETEDYLVNVIGATPNPENRTLTVATAGSGTGNVTSSPSGINTADGINSFDFSENEVVTLTATPTGGSSFINWTGDCSGTNTSVAVTMNADKNCTANFGAASTTPPTVTTQAVTSITSTTATGNGNITSLGAPNPTAHGMVWNTSGTPTTADNSTNEGAAGSTGAFTTNMTGLTQGTNYYVRAYATNTAGTVYGNEVTFTTLAPVIEVIGNTYIIPNGSSVPSETNHTDFGNVVMQKNSLKRTFTIKNNGNYPLTLTDPSPYISITGPNAGEFSITAIPSSPIGASGDSTLFQITFIPAATGIRTATVNIANNDADENPYQFAIRGRSLTIVSIGDYVWNDADRDGIQDADESGIKDVIISLYSREGSLIKREKSASDGKYLFHDRHPGAYYAVFTNLPPGYQFSPYQQENKKDRDSDADPATGRTELMIFDGTYSTYYDCDAGIFLNDTDGDGITNNHESKGDRDNDGIPDCEDYDPKGYIYDQSTGKIVTGGRIKVTASNNKAEITISKNGSTGLYQFWTDGTKGTYTLELILPEGYQLSSTRYPHADILNPDPETDSDPIVLGQSEYSDTKKLTSWIHTDNPYYLSFYLEAGDPYIINNNIPIERIIGDSWGKDKNWVLARYQSWYGSAESDSVLRHWDESYNGGHIHTSLSGEYSSTDLNMAEYHILQAWASGIDGFVVDWYGKNSYENSGTKNLLESADELYQQYRDKGFNFEIAVSYNEKARDSMSTNFKYIADSLMSQPAYWGKKRDIRRPLFIFDTEDELINLEDYADLSNYLPVDAFLLCNGNESATFNSSDVCYPCIQPSNGIWDSEGMEWGETYLDTSYARINSQAASGKLLFGLGSVWPGFDDRNWSLGEDHWMNRQGSLVYHETWEKIHDYEDQLTLPWCFIETWNDFNRATQIEPTEEYGYKFNLLTRDHARRFKQTLPSDSVGVENPGLIVPLHILQARRAADADPENAADINNMADQALSKFFNREYLTAVSLADQATNIAPPQLTAGTITDTSVVLSWDAAESECIYNIYYSTDRTNFEPCAPTGPKMIEAGNTGELRLDGLIPDTEYYIAITAVDSSLNNESWYENTNTGAEVISIETFGSTGIDNNRSGLPDNFSMQQNYPNPFNPETMIHYDLPVAQHVILKIYDIRGREVATLIEKNMDAGYHKIIVNGNRFATGIYIYRLTTEKFNCVRKMILLK